MLPNYLGRKFSKKNHKAALGGAIIVRSVVGQVLNVKNKKDTNGVRI